MLHALALVVLTQGLPLKSGATSDLADVTPQKQLKVSVYGPDGGYLPLVDRDGHAAEFADDGRLDIGRDTPLFVDRFTGTAVAAHNKWAQSILTQTATVGAGAITLNASAITTVNTYSILLSVPKFRGFFDGSLYVHARARVNNLPQTNAEALLGLANVATTAAPTDGAFFRWTSSGGFECVVNRGGTETSTTMTAPTAGVYYNYAVRASVAAVVCTYTREDTGDSLSVTIPLPSGSPSVFNESPSAVMAVRNGAVAPALAPQMLVGALEVMTKVVDTTRPVGHLNAMSGQASAYVPTTGAQSTNHANSTSPTSATLSNTAAGYTTLGGRYQFAAPAGAATDFALFGYQVPTSFRFVVTGIAINTCNTGAAVATTATLLDWGIATDSTAVSLATADAIAASPTSAPRRVPLGMQGFVVGAAIGACAADIVRDLSQAPITVESGRFLHVIVQVPVGTATASQVIRGDVVVMGYFEQ
jgi:hypothetical protein